MTTHSLAYLAIVLAQAPAPPERARPLRPSAEIGLSWHASGTKGAVATGGAESAAAGLEILEAGGNAADAAVATILALTVTDAHLFCFGGEVPIIVYDARRKVVEVVAGQGVAPRLATREFFASRGGIPTVGLLPAAVPATLDACTVTLERYGTKRFADVVAPTLRLLDRGQEPWHADLARTLRRLLAAEKSTDDRLRGLRLVSDTFYRGAIAREIDAWCRANDGLLRFEDLATHATRIEDPVCADYRGYTVCKCGLWTQGPALLQTLQVLEAFDAPDAGPGRAASIHRAVEALKLGLADRDAYYADPLFAEVPLDRLLDPSYAAKRRALINPERASLELRPGDPLHGEPLRHADTPAAGAESAGLDTTTCLVADQWGNVVAATPSGWSGVVAGETGVWLGTRLQSFRMEADHPDVIAPGKRPRITLTPTLVLKDGKPVMAVSVAGGDLQDQVSLQMLMNLIDYEMSPEQAVSAPRYSTAHHIGSFAQSPPELGSLQLNDGLDEAEVEQLRGRGHRITATRGAIGNPVVLAIDPTSGRIDAAGCPKSRRHAAAY
jgi:gamma-glutamyltranspeptidase/glutathione hydrolase